MVIHVIILRIITWRPRVNALPDFVCKDLLNYIPAIFQGLEENVALYHLKYQTDLPLMTFSSQVMPVLYKYILLTVGLCFDPYSTRGNLP